MSFKLQAVNILLGTIQELPVQQLDDQSDLDVSQAQLVLDEVCEAVQLESWNFNTEHGVLLSPNKAHEISLSPHILKIDSCGKDCCLSVVQRGLRLYNKDKRSYRFTDPIEVSLTLKLPFEDLPPTFRRYITIRAARLFQTRVVGSEALSGFSQEEERIARIEAEKADGQSSDYNMLTGHADVSSILRYRGP